MGFRKAIGFSTLTWIRPFSLLLVLYLYQRKVGIFFYIEGDHKVGVRLHRLWKAAVSNFPANYNKLSYKVQRKYPNFNMNEAATNDSTTTAFFFL